MLGGGGGSTKKRRGPGGELSHARPGDYRYDPDDWQPPNWAYIDQTILRELRCMPRDLDDWTLSEFALIAEKQGPSLVEPDWFVWDYRAAKNATERMNVLRRMFA